MRRTTQMRWLQIGLAGLGVVLLATWAKTAIEAGLFQARESRRLETALQHADSLLADTTPAYSAVIGAPAAPAPAAPALIQAANQDGVLGRIEIPRLAISAIVAEGVDLKTLSRAVGHVSTTAQPGCAGNCALAGHRDSFLQGLGGVRENDVIRFVTRRKTYTYRVQKSEIVSPQRIDVLDPTPTPSLTLITCYPFHYIGHAPNRFIVRARQIDAATADAAPGGTGVTAVAASRR